MSKTDRRGAVKDATSAAEPTPGAAHAGRAEMAAKWKYSTLHLRRIALLSRRKYAGRRRAHRHEASFLSL
jgi:hypothetical protein